MKRAKFLAALLVIASIGIPARAFAWPPTYGAEFELTNDDLIKNSSSGSYVTQAEKDELRKFVDKIRNKCIQRKCKVSDAPGKWAGKYAVTVTLENGWTFHVDIDPKCVEIQTQPSTLAELKRLTPQINDLIFKTAKSVGLRADFATGSGHFNMGVRSAFGDDPRAFLDYFVDYANHPELAAGAMSYDMFNAPPVSALAEDQRAALADIVRRSERGEYKNIPEVADQLSSRVYYKSVHPSAAGDHYQALSIKKLRLLADGDVPLEIRAMWPQARIEDFTLMAELTEKRLAFLKAERVAGRKIRYINLSGDLFSGEQAVSRFYAYVAEAGGDWHRYKNLLRPVAREYRIDPFLAGKPDWRNPDYPKALEDHLRFIPSSRFLSERIRSALMNPQAVRMSGVGILRRIQAMADQANDPEEKEAFQGFLKGILKSKPWTSRRAQALSGLKSLTCAEAYAGLSDGR